MPPQCNIDSKGKAIRMIYGIVLSLVGVLLVFTWALPAGEWFAWTVTMLLLAGGLFAIYEARAGWCAARAMGFKTRF